MTLLTENDRHWGPFTWGPWSKTFSLTFNTGGDEDEARASNNLRLIAFGWVLRVRLPNLVQPWRKKVVACSWDAATIDRMGRNWYYDVHERTFGVCLSDMGNGYDFLQVKFGAQTHSSNTTMDWCCHLPWKQSRCVRHTVYTPEGEVFGHSNQFADFIEFYRHQEKCPAVHFGFEDFDGKMIVATCTIEEREWHRGEGWFKWLRWFYPRKIRRSLDIKFSEEVGTEKGSWKGGPIGHGIDMLAGETPRAAFERYCAKEHDGRQGRKFRLRFIGPCNAPESKNSEVTK